MNFIKLRLYHHVLQPIVDNIWDEDNGDYEIDPTYIEEAEDRERVDLDKNAMGLATIVHSILCNIDL